MQQYIDEKLAKPMGWGRWRYRLRQGQTVLPHTSGGGSIAARSTDAVRFGYMLLRHGQWSGQQLVPADYVAACGQPSKYQKHAPFSLMFEVNADGHVAGAPRDAYFKSGAGGVGIYVIPSLDMVIYKMAATISSMTLTLRACRKRIRTMGREKSGNRARTVSSVTGRSGSRIGFGGLWRWYWRPWRMAAIERCISSALIHRVRIISGRTRTSAAPPLTEASEKPRPEPDPGADWDNHHETPHISNRTDSFRLHYSP
jgi:hypothetical protein